MALHKVPIIAVIAAVICLSHELKNDIPEPKVILESKRVFTSESVTLQCDIQPNSTDWNYKWWRSGHRLTNIENVTTYSISSATKEHSGQYYCQGDHKKKSLITEISKSVRLRVKELPKPQLNLLSKWSKIFSSEEVVLKCDIPVDQAAEWLYKWYVNGQELTFGNTSMYSISSAAKEHSGLYTCQGVYTKRPLTTNNSSGIQVLVSELPRSHLTLESNWTKVFSSESVIMKCDIHPGSTEWHYRWYRNGQVVGTLNADKYSISSAVKENSGQYTCQGVHKNRSITTSDSNNIELIVEDLPKPVLTLMTTWTKVFYSENVTMKCDIQPNSIDWHYKWYKNHQEVPFNEDTFSIYFAITENTGKYTCRGFHKIRSVTTTDSDSMGIIVDDLPVPQLTSDWRNVFSSQPVDLKCRIQPDSTHWDYIWYRNGQTFSVSGNVDTHSISSATKGHAGQYACQGNHITRLVTTETSKSFHLLVSDLPKPHLTLESKWTKVFPSEKVNMMCDIQPNSTDWHYKWYKNGQEFLYTMDGQKIDSDKKRLIQLASSGQSGNYTCVGKHKTMPVSTTASNMIDLYVYDEKLVPVVRQYPSFEFMYEEEEVTLQCEVAYLPSIWKYHWFKNTQKEQLHGGHEMNYTFSSTRHMNNEKFFCESERDTYRSERSRPVNLLVKPLPSASLTVDTSWTDILSVDSLTLLCEVHYKDNYGWNFTWFRDGTQLSDSFQERLSVKATEEMYESEFQCKGFRTERPTSSTFSEAFKANNLVLKRKLLLSISGCVITGIVLTVLGCIYLKCRRKPAVEKEPQPDLFMSMQDAKTDALIPSNRYSYVGGDPFPTKECHSSEESLCMYDVELEQRKDDDGTTNYAKLKSFKGS
ncbi:Fc receptor-like protein 5 isoform X1 [Denticeps clupeoides]|uniref:Ig-like domain-containing protein n=1 Tax=Denticeps clupeoides TaxID=299321 RepID=A0AAY4CB35_9TELE|nr:Fc receptor-like protein 5 isoform X1 [Denticeps clupeoides]